MEKIRAGAGDASPIVIVLDAARAETQPTRPVVLPGGEVRAAQSPEVEMSDRTRDHLEALGYLK